MRARPLFALALAAVLLGGAAQARQQPAAALTSSAPVAEPVTAAPFTAAPVTAAPATSAPATAAASAPPLLPAAKAAQAATPFAGAAAGSLLQTIFALCVVLGLLAVLAWAMKRFGPRAIGGSAHLRLVGGMSLGGRERIMVIEVGDQWIVVGASPGRVNALATMPRQGAAAGGTGSTGSAALHAGADSATSFSAWLKQTIDKRNAD